MLAITASKTYSQWLIDNPNFFDEYLEDDLIDEATVLSINKWYKYRVICDDIRFTEFFERQLDLILPRYNKLLRQENVEFDALVNVYRERQVVDMGSELGSETSNLSRATTESGTDAKTTTRTPDLTTEKNGETTKTVDTDTTDSNDRSSTRTPNLTTTDNGTTSSTSETDTTNHTEGENSSESAGMNASVGKQNPQSISYASGFDSDGMPSLDWSYPSNQAQTKNRNETSGSNESNGTGSSDTTQSGSSANTNVLTGTDNTQDIGYSAGTLDTTENGTSENTETLTGTDTTVESGTHSRNGSIADEGSKDIERTTSNTKREIFTGRDGLTPQAALKEAMSYIKTSSSFVWLKDQLEVCFLSVYDI